MSAVWNRVMPRSIALWITLREVSRSVRWPKLLQPRPTAETRRPEPPRLRICMGYPVRRDVRNGGAIVARRSGRRKARSVAAGATQASQIASNVSAQTRNPENALVRKVRHKKMRPRSDAATDGDRFGARDRDGGPDQTRAKPSPVMLRGGDSQTYPQALPQAVQAGRRRYLASQI